MCVILSVSHIPCTHIISIWQHCGEATRYRATDPLPCRNVRQEIRAILTREPCADCGGGRVFARRGGVAERGEGSPTTTSARHEASNDKDVDDEDGDDSGYHSDVIHEEGEEHYGIVKRSLSPRTTSPMTEQLKRTSKHRTMTRKPSWRLNLKQDLSVEEATCSLTRRESIGSMLSSTHTDDPSRKSVPSSMKQTDICRPDSIFMTSFNPPHRRRGSTLLHPSSPPPMETTASAQVAVSFPFPQMIDVKKASSTPKNRLPERKNSTLLHPSPPLEDAPAEASMSNTPLLHGKQHVQNAPPPRIQSSLAYPCPPTETPRCIERPTIRPIRSYAYLKDQTHRQQAPAQQKLRRITSL